MSHSCEIDNPIDPLAAFHGETLELVMKRILLNLS